jgi:hypothetical protein
MSAGHFSGLLSYLRSHSFVPVNTGDFHFTKTIVLVLY